MIFPIAGATHRAVASQWPPGPQHAYSIVPICLPPGAPTSRSCREAPHITTPSAQTGRGSKEAHAEQGKSNDVLKHVLSLAHAEQLDHQEKRDEAAVVDDAMRRFTIHFQRLLSMHGGEQLP